MVREIITREMEITSDGKSLIFKGVSSTFHVPIKGVELALKRAKQRQDV